MNPREILTRPAPAPDYVISYGPGSEQVADLWLPAQPVGLAGDGALILLLHGGFWRAAFDRMHARPMAAALAAEGFAVCVPEYRRTGQDGGGWPGTFDDVALAVDVLPGLATEASGAAPAGTAARAPVLAGHSAGGHLALWAAVRGRLPVGSRWHSGAAVGGVVALAAVSDLTGCAEQDLGGGAAAALMGGGPGEWPDRYALADPMLLPPGTAPARLVHGETDDIVPCGMSVAYAERVVGAGGDVGCEVLPGCGHFEVIDPLSRAWPEVAAAFREVAG
jgi:acetyl esterase/lipase